MPVMRRLHVGGTTYDTVGEASVTQVQTSGTKIATVTIDGTATDIYAPESGGSGLVVPTYTLTGETTATCDMTFAQVLAAVEDGTCTYAVIAGDGIAVYMLSYGDDYISFSSNYISSSIMTISIEHDASGIAYATSTLALPSASSTAPSMDGTAAVGSSSKYAREDHVHPTDTSRQATLVSGTNIKTVMGASLLGSGNVAMPTASTSTLGGVKVDGTTIMAAADGTISASGGGGGDPYDLVVNVTVSAAGAVLSHDVVPSECIAFAKAVVSGQDMHAVAFCRRTSYDDEDEIYVASVDILPFVRSDTSSYGVGQYEADGGWALVFLVVNSINSGRASGAKLSISSINDDPEIPPTITYSSL